jgi:hypothetical protein
MEEFSERYFHTTIRALAANSPEFFNVDLSNHNLQTGLHSKNKSFENINGFYFGLNKKKNFLY